MNNDQDLYKGWMTLKKRTLGTRSYEVLIKKNAVGALIEDKAGNFLLVQQFRPALLRETLEIPAGVTDKDGLSEQEIMVEELMEEAHLDITPEALIPLVRILPEVGISASTIQLYYCKVESIGENQKIEDDQDVTAICWLTPEELNRGIQKGDIQDAKTILAYFCYQQKFNLK